MTCILLRETSCQRRAARSWSCGCLRCASAHDARKRLGGFNLVGEFDNGAVASLLRRQMQRAGHASDVVDGCDVDPVGDTNQKLAMRHIGVEIAKRRCRMVQRSGQQHIPESVTPNPPSIPQHLVIEQPNIAPNPKSVQSSVVRARFFACPATFGLTYSCPARAGTILGNSDFSYDIFTRPSTPFPKEWQMTFLY